MADEPKTTVDDDNIELRVRSTVNLERFPALEERTIKGRANIEACAGFLARGYLVPIVAQPMTDDELPPAEAARRAKPK